MPTISSPEPAYFALRACSLGKELLHGVQNVPQKSTSTTFPCSCLSDTRRRASPATGATLKSGAGLPTRPPSAAGAETAGPPAPATQPAWLRRPRQAAPRAAAERCIMRHARPQARQTQLESKEGHTLVRAYRAGVPQGQASCSGLDRSGSVRGRGRTDWPAPISATHPSATPLSTLDSLRAHRPKKAIAMALQLILERPRGRGRRRLRSDAQLAGALAGCLWPARRRAQPAAARRCTPTNGVLVQRQRRRRRGLSAVRRRQASPTAGSWASVEGGSCTGATRDLQRRGARRARPASRTTAARGRRAARTIRPACRSPSASRRPALRTTSRASPRAQGASAPGTRDRVHRLPAVHRLELPGLPRCSSAAEL